MNSPYKRLLVGTLLIIISYFIFTPQAKAQFTITENFKSSSVGSNVILGGNPSATLTSGINDPVNEGWLRLTKDANDQRGYAYINTTFPSSIGVYIEFEYKTWRSRADTSYNGADGICVYLFDATKTFSIGAFGGSLGYANQNSVPGLAGGYIGIGFDEYGNFVRSSEGKNGGTSNLAPNSIILRGPENPGGTLKPYRYLIHEQLQTSSSNNGVTSVDYNTATSTRPDDEQFYRKVLIYVEPIGTTSNPKYRIRVLWRTSPDNADIPLVSYETTDPIPSLLKLGFGASTGGGFNYHEIRNVLITTPGGVRISKSVDKVNTVEGNNITYTVNVYNETSAKLTNLLFDETIKDGNGNTLSLSDFEISSITFNNRGNANNIATGYTSGTPKTSGFTNPFSSTLTIDANNSVSFTIVGKAKKMPGGGTIVNTASVDPTNSGITDTDLTNNQATVTTSILNPNVDLKIEKGVSNNGIAQLSGNTYTITVSNVSTNSKPDSKVVSVTDIIPEGLTVTGYTAEGWSLSQTGNSYTFSRSNELASMYAYPPITINVKPSGSGPWINTATVNYAEDTNLANNSSSVKLSWLNYWQGTIDTDWAKQGNWTANAVPLTGENIEFATEINNGASGKGNGTGAAIKDLYLDKDRTIGDLINDSNVDLVVTTENQLTINGSVKDNNPNKGTIRVKTSPDKATGTLLFTNPGNNTAVNATVEFYNKAYECETCGFYRKQWQYFGIPVNASSFPYTGVETVNQWVEPYNGNKWRPAPYAPDVALQAFKGYEITNSSTTLPDKIYNFSGLLNVDDAIVTTSKTAAVNYSGMNLIGNSYTAAIPISKDAIAFESDLLTEETVYLFNTGTRDQWRKLNGSIAYGVNGGQYQAVPIEVANQEGLPDRILSMHTFMLNTKKNGSIGIEYSKLVKNQLINQQAWRSAKSSNAPLPYIIMDVISNSSADRVWLFENATASYGFDNGWDGYKISETDIIQAYVTDLENEKYQIATVPQLTGSTLGLEAGKGEGYTLNLSVAPEVESRNLYLQDLQTGKNFAIKNNSEYYVEGSSLPKKRFKIVEGISSTPDTEYISSLINIYVKDNTVTVNNQSDMDCTAFIYDLRGILIVQKKISAYQTEYFNNIPLLGKGVYIVKVKSDKHSLNEVSRVMVQ